MEPASHLVASASAIAPSFGIILWGPLLLLTGALLLWFFWLVHAQRKAASGQIRQAARREKLGQPRHFSAAT